MSARFRSCDSSFRQFIVYLLHQERSLSALVPRMKGLACDSWLDVFWVEEAILRVLTGWNVNKLFVPKLWALKFSRTLSYIALHTQNVFFLNLADSIVTLRLFCLTGNSFIFIGKEQEFFVRFGRFYMFLVHKMYFLIEHLGSTFSTIINGSRSSYMTVNNFAFPSVAIFVERISASTIDISNSNLNCFSYLLKK